MTSLGKKRLSRTSLLIVAALALASGGCGEDFQNEPRAPVPIELTAVVQPGGVTVSPDRVGAGPIVITISNQTDDSQNVTLAGDSVQEDVGPINPRDTATIQKTVAQGAYTVGATSEDGRQRAVRAAKLDVGPPRAESNDRILLP